MTGFFQRDGQSGQTGLNVLSNVALADFDLGHGVALEQKSELNGVVVVPPLLLLVVLVA